MATDPLRTAERAWAIAYLATLLGGVACIVMGVFRRDPWLYIGAGLLAAHILARSAVREYDERRNPARRRSLFTELIFLALFSPVVVLLTMAASVLIALFRETGFLQALGRGAWIGALLVAGIALLDVIGRFIRFVLFR